MSPFLLASFAVAAGRAREFPAPDRPEVAFAGRSNVGKSSAINALANRKRLAFVSKTPGRTQTINFFDLGEQGRLVDLPGYGYAGAPQAVRAGWERLAGGYFKERRCLAGVVVLTDARRPLSASDLQLLEWLRPLAVPRLVLLAKSDLLSRTERAAALARTRGTLARLGVAARLLPFSSRDQQGAAQARDLLQQWLRDGRPAAGNKKPPAKGNATGGKAP